MSRDPVPQPFHRRPPAGRPSVLVVPPTLEFESLARSCFGNSLLSAYSLIPNANPSYQAVSRKWLRVADLTLY
ncbi:hypothetical protein Nepgr_030355 [Nepenthes gracilis]|uniref:Uncharacterized protein n=1 Tax=Nepenthes gracilis TaxID=150966 RepID=A0AAD3Y3T8_NEPGR|nr:hypothetical protein Nepgr_030355 [Nepenthes gracilis]